MSDEPAKTTRIRHSSLEDKVLWHCAAKPHLPPFADIDSHVYKCKHDCKKHTVIECDGLDCQLCDINFCKFKVGNIDDVIAVLAHFCSGSFLIWLISDQNFSGGPASGAITEDGRKFINLTI